MGSVQRYSVATQFDDDADCYMGHMASSPSGDYVTFADYETLQRERDEARAEAADSEAFLEAARMDYTLAVDSIARMQANLTAAESALQAAEARIAGAPVVMLDNTFDAGAEGYFGRYRLLLETGDDAALHAEGGE